MLTRTLLKFSLVFTLVVIVLGAFTRLSDAGLGCPDWPGCYGQLFVPSEPTDVAVANSLYPERQVEPYKAWLEMIHRYFAGTLGLLILTMTVIAWHNQPELRKVFTGLCFLVLFQAALGMWTVTLQLKPIVVMGHLLGGVCLFCLLLYAYCRTSHERKRTRQPLSKSVSYLCWLCLVVVAGQISLGGWTSANYAALICTELPLCEGNWYRYLDWSKAFELWQGLGRNYEFGVLDYPARMTIHVTHRFGALLTSLCIGSLCLWLWRTGHLELKRAALLLAGLLVTQVLLGIGNVKLQLPIGIAVAHNLVAVLILATVVIITYRVRQHETVRQSVQVRQGTQERKNEPSHYPEESRK